MKVKIVKTRVVAFAVLKCTDGMEGYIHMQPIEIPLDANQQEHDQIKTDTFNPLDLITVVSATGVTRVCLALCGDDGEPVCRPLVHHDHEPCDSPLGYDITGVDNSAVWEQCRKEAQAEVDAEDEHGYFGWYFSDLVLKEHCEQDAVQCIFCEGESSTAICRNCREKIREVDSAAKWMGKQ